MRTYIVGIRYSLNRDITYFILTTTNVRKLLTFLHKLLENDFYQITRINHFPDLKGDK